MFLWYVEFKRNDSELKNKVRNFGLARYLIFYLDLLTLPGAAQWSDDVEIQATLFFWESAVFQAQHLLGTGSFLEPDEKLKLVIENCV